MNKILILDFGSQFTQLIARRMRELGYYSFVLPGSAPLSRIREFGPSAVILSGGPASVYEEGSPQPAEGFFEHVASSNLPLLGICYGMQLMVQHGRGEIRPAHKREYGRMKVRTLGDSPLFSGIREFEAWMSHGDETTRLLNAIKSTAIDHEVFHDREGFGAEWLDPNGVAIAEFTHVKLAGRSGFFRAVGDAVDGHGAHAADAFTAIMVKGHGISSILNQALIDNVHHLQEGGMIGDLTCLNILEMTGLTLILTPDFELEVEE
jgi:GMP synthase (glutamine-hydrolysing) A subunit